MGIQIAFKLTHFNGYWNTIQIDTFQKASPAQFGTDKMVDHAFIDAADSALHTEESFLNRVNPKRIWTVIIIFR